MNKPQPTFWRATTITVALTVKTTGTVLSAAIFKKKRSIKSGNQFKRNQRLPQH